MTDHSIYDLHSPSQHEQTLAELDALRAENERLKEEMAEWKAAHAETVSLREIVEGHMDMARMTWTCVAEIERLRHIHCECEYSEPTPCPAQAENERLRAALNRLAPDCDVCGQPMTVGPAEWQPFWWCAHESASRTLGTPPQNPQAS